ncbi:MAG: glucose-6-phosphate dehydrogenase, partial [Phycisphaerae bacterium]|nr:glucose-6-phosphate dehydrogenase [Phycisphaerae bacterium]
YERLLLDAAVGDATLFTRSDEVEAAWRFVTPVIEGCTQSCCESSTKFFTENLAEYPAGTWGPNAAHELIEADGRKWHLR